MMLEHPHSSASWDFDDQGAFAGIAAARSHRTIEVRTLGKRDMAAALPALRHLRATVFRDWPYLYDADPEFESAYLHSIATVEGAALVVALDGDVIVGAASVSPLTSQEDDIVRPLEAIGWDIGSTVYFGESLLLTAYRGQGIGHLFFDARETFARAEGARRAAFASVKRPEIHPLRPSYYRPLDNFWRRRGYQPIERGSCNLVWKDVCEASELPHAMQVWTRILEAGE